MTNWAAGYVTDIEYTAGFYGDQAPSVLRMACLLNGIEAPAGAGGFAYCELGCGVGLTALILAASNPRSRFYAVDFNPVHVLRARSLAKAAGLTNIQFLECGFEDLLGDEHALPSRVDFITLHGVYSWVSRETRAAIASVIERYLNSGGLVFVSYNAMPGWFQGLPVQRLLRELAGLTSGRSDERIVRAITQIDALKRAGAGTLTKSELINRLTEMLTSGDERYLAHEYLNENWHPMYHIDVARELAAAKVQYAGSANLLYNFPEARLSQGQREIIDKIGSPDLSETLADFCSNQMFRRDVFMRGVPRLHRARQEELLRNLKLALIVPRAQFKFQLQMPSGTADLNRESYSAIADALAERPRRVDELLQLPAVQKSGRMTAGELLGVLVGTHQAAPLSDDVAPTDQGRADQLNLALGGLLEHSRWNTSAGLAVASLGSGIRCDMVEYSVFRDLLAKGGVLDSDGISTAVYEGIVAQNGKVLDSEGKAFEGREESLDYLRSRVRKITEYWLPVWQQFWPQLCRA